MMRGIDRRAVLVGVAAIGKLPDVLRHGSALALHLASFPDRRRSGQRIALPLR
jgi:hypothetical protein